MFSKRAFLFVNGDLPNADAMAAQVQPDDLLVAVDGGLRHLAMMGRVPDVLIGDLDSVEPADVAGCRMAGSEVIRHPPDKNETDLELAIDLALERGFTDLVIAGALGGRLDQTLGNIFLLARPSLARVQAHLDDGVQRVSLVRDALDWRGMPDDTVSLLPLTEEVTGVFSEGLQYPLQGETLYRHATRGISNVMVSSAARVEISSGQLIVIQTRRLIESPGEE